MISDLVMWDKFVKHPSIFCHPFMDFTKKWTAEEILFFTDTSKNFELGCGGYCENSWFQAQWLLEVRELDPSIQYLELYALTIGVLNWIHRFQNRRIIIFSDNIGVVNVINNSSSKCKNCMVLVRVIVLHSLIHNVKIIARYIPSKSNEITDSLSRLQTQRFLSLTQG